MDLCYSCFKKFIFSKDKILDLLKTNKKKLFDNSSVFLHEPAFSTKEDIEKLGRMERRRYSERQREGEIGRKIRGFIK